MKTTSKHFFAFLFCCLALPLLSGCSNQSHAQNAKNKGNTDAETVKQDLREINEYAEARDYNVWVIPTRKSNEHTNVEKFMNTKRAANLTVWTKAAEAGIPEGQILLGLRYLHGMGVAADEAAAVNYLGQAAEQGYMDAQFNYGVCFVKGIGVPQDDKEAEKWFVKATEQLTKIAEQGDAKAQMRLGEVYFDGVGIAKDEALGALWIQKAAEQGNAEAQHLFGMLYFRGRGVPEDEKEAENWFRKAKEQGHKEAASLLQGIEEKGKELQTQYNRLVQRKDRANTENEYQELAKQFRAMNGYKDTAKLAGECDTQFRTLKDDREEKELEVAKQKAQELQEEYEQLLQSKNSATTENEYQELAMQFRAMNGYKDTAELANECDDASEALKQEKEQLARELQRAQRLAILDGAVDKDEEFRRSGFDRYDHLLRFGNARLREKVTAEERIRDRADAFDKPAAQRRVDAVWSEINEVRDEIAKKTFLGEYSYSTYNVKFDERRNEGSCTVRFSPYIVHRGVGGNRFPISFPMPGITIIERDLPGYDGDTFDITISSSADRIQELVRNSDNYLVRVRFQNLRNTWNNNQRTWADILSVDIIDKVKEQADLAAGRMPTKPLAPTDNTPANLDSFDEEDFASTEPALRGVPTGYIAEEVRGGGRGGRSSRQQDQQEQNQQTRQNDQPGRTSAPVRDAIIREGLNRIPRIPGLPF